MGIGYVLCGLGGVSRIMGHYRDSLAYYTRAHTTLREIKDTFGTAYSFCGMANAHRMSGDFERALSYFDRATYLYQEIGDRISYAYTLWGEGTTFKMVGKEEEAIESFQSAEVIFQATGDQRGQISPSWARGKSPSCRGRPLRPRGCLRRPWGSLRPAPFGWSNATVTSSNSSCAGKKVSIYLWRRCARSIGWSGAISPRARSHCP